MDPSAANTGKRNGESAFNLRVIIASISLAIVVVGGLISIGVTVGLRESRLAVVEIRSAANEDSIRELRSGQTAIERKIDRLLIEAGVDPDLPAPRKRK